MQTANERLRDLSTRQAIFRERFKGSEAKKLVALYRELEADLVAKLIRRDPTAVAGRYTTARLARLLDDVREVIEAFGADLYADARGTLEKFASIEVDVLIRHIGEALPVVLDKVRPAMVQIRAAIDARPLQGRFLKEWYADLTVATQARVRAAIRIGVVEGETVQQISKRLREATELSRRGAEMVTRTAVNHVSTVARETTYAENDDLISGVQWVSTLDGRTSAVCRARDGKVFPLDGGPRPPAHPSCRSSTIPVLKNWRQLGIDADDAPEGTRASMNGQVAASTTYQDWLRAQPAGFQDEVLGKAKGALFRRGGLSLDKFVDRSGAELNLDALRARHAEAFDEAGI